MSENLSNPEAWGRIDDQGTVYVRTREGERVVGQWPDGDPAEAMALFTRRYEGLAVEVELLEKRIASDSLSPRTPSERSTRSARPSTVPPRSATSTR